MRMNKAGFRRAADLGVFQHNRPFASLQDRLVNGRKVRESGLWLKGVDSIHILARRGVRNELGDFDHLLVRGLYALSRSRVPYYAQSEIFTLKGKGRWHATAWPR